MRMVWEMVSGACWGPTNKSWERTVVIKTTGSACSGSLLWALGQCKDILQAFPYHLEHTDV